MLGIRSILAEFVLGVSSRTARFHGRSSEDTLTVGVAGTLLPPPGSAADGFRTEYALPAEHGGGTETLEIWPDSQGRPDYGIRTTRQDGQTSVINIDYTYEQTNRIRPPIAPPTPPATPTLRPTRTPTPAQMNRERERRHRPRVPRRVIVSAPEHEDGMREVFRPNHGGVKGSG